MLVIVGFLLIFGLVVRYKWKNGAAKKDEILRLVAVASEEEAQIAQLQDFEDYSSPSYTQPQLEKKYHCAICHCPTTTRCARCKAVRYCSGKCQIIHWRQGHHNECRPATALPSSNKGGYDSETALENQFATHLKNEVGFNSHASQEFNDSRSSRSSPSCSFSSTEHIESSLDASINEDKELGTPIRQDKAPPVGVGSHISKSLPDSDGADVPSPTLPVYSVVHPPRSSKIEKIKTDETFRLTSARDKRTGDGIAELRSSQSSGAARTSSAEDNGKHLEQMLKNELQVCSSYERRSIPTFRSACNSDSSHVVFSEIEGVRNVSQDTRNSLKTYVWKFVQHFKSPKQSKSYAFDTVDSGGTYNHKIIFPQKLFMQLYSCDDVELHPFGLVNCGNSCYANAVLQCLTFTRPIASYLLHEWHSKTCRKRDWCFICKFEHLIKRGQATGSPISPVGLLSQIQPIGREEDAHEFLRNVVDKMQYICLEEAGASGSLSEDSTFMDFTFGGSLRSKIKCMKCFERFERCDRMMDLTVEIDGNIRTLEDALKKFTASETLGGDDKYKCSRCKSYEKAKKKLTVFKAPNILTIVLKRFRSGNLEKLNKLVKFPEVLNLSPYMSGMSDSYSVYHLYALVVHLGMSATYSGHYVSYVKDFHGDWFIIDDSRVSHVDLQTVLSVEAYILFYARQTPRGASFIRNSSSSYSDLKTKRNMETISSRNNSKKKNSKTKPNSCGRNTEPTPCLVSSKHSHWISPNAVDPNGWGFHKNHIIDSSSSDSCSIFSTSDAGSYSTDSTKDSSTEDISGYIFGSSWYNP